MKVRVVSAGRWIESFSPVGAIWDKEWGAEAMARAERSLYNEVKSRAR